MEDKIYLWKQKFIEYNNERFSSKNDFKNYLLENATITSILTSSNLNKIIKDIENKTLDESKIYDIDPNKFIQIYRDAYGKIARTMQDALDTYTNLGLVKEQYSYDNEG